VKASELIELNEYRALVWGSRHVDEMDARGAEMLVTTLFADVPALQALEVLHEFAQRQTAFPPSWAEVRERWQARNSGVGDDLDLIANRWLVEVNLAVGKLGGTFYRPMPEFSDPIIAAAVEQAAGSWSGWGATTVGGEGDGGAFTRNLVPERDERFRRAVKAMLLHRRRTGESLPEIVAVRPAGWLERPVYELPAATGAAIGAKLEDEDAAIVEQELAAREADRAEREERKAEARARLEELRER